MFVVVYRPHNTLQIETKFIGPFTAYADAYDALCLLPALGEYAEAIEGGVIGPGVRFIQELTPLDDALREIAGGGPVPEDDGLFVTTEQHGRVVTMRLVEREEGRSLILGETTEHASATVGRLLWSIAALGNLVGSPEEARKRFRHLRLGPTMNDVDGRFLTRLSCVIDAAKEG